VKTHDDTPSEPLRTHTDGELLRVTLQATQTHEADMKVP